MATPQVGTDFQTLVLDRQVRYLNAYPSVRGLRPIPHPFALRQEKNASSEDSSIVLYSGETARDKQLVTPPIQYLAELNGRWLGTSSSISTKAHIARDRAKGKAWSEQVGNDETQHGAMFSYQFLEARTVFRGAIQLLGEDAERNAESLREILTGVVFLGRSRRANYGHAEIRFTSIGDSEYEKFGRRDIQAGERFHLVLTSEYVGRDQRTGQINPAAIVDDVRALLGNMAVVENYTTGHTVVGGFNRKWGLQLPQSLAAAQGSVVSLLSLRPIANTELRALENHGLGERLNEGYGRFLILDLPSKVTVTTQDIDQIPERVDTEQIASPLVIEIEQRIFRDQLRQRIWHLAFELARTATSLPTNSLLGRLRTPLRSKRGLETLSYWLSGELKPPALKLPALRQLEACRLPYAKLNLADWIRSALDLSPNNSAALQAFATRLGVAEAAEKSCITSPEQLEAYFDINARDFAVILIDDLLGLLSKMHAKRDLNLTEKI